MPTPSDLEEMVIKYRSNEMIMRQRRKYPHALPDFPKSLTLKYNNKLIWIQMYALIPDEVEQDIIKLMAHINSKGRNV